MFAGWIHSNLENLLMFSPDFDHICIRIHDLIRSCIFDVFLNNNALSFNIFGKLTFVKIKHANP